MRASAVIAVLALVLGCGAGAEEPLPQRESNYSLRNEAELSLGRGLKWLENHQKPDGSWSDPALPGLSGLALTAFLREPAGKYRTDPRRERAEKACEFLRSAAAGNGRIGGKVFAIFNTAASLSALVVHADPRDGALMGRAVAYLANRQRPSGGFADEPAGGKRPAADLPTTEEALEALRVYLAMVPEASAGKSLPDWEKAQGFAARCQLSPGRKAPPIAAKDAGGFHVRPAGDRPGPAGPPASSGALTSAGLLCYIYTGLPREAPRVQAALGWLQRNYTLDENPGAGADDYYSGLWQMAKGLAAAGPRDLDLADGKKVDWARQLALKILDLQQPDGSWVNKAGSRWREDDPTLVTSYVALTLEIVYWRL